MEDKISMSQKECKQASIFERIICNKLTQKAASVSLNMSVRQVRNKLKRYKLHGARGLIHKSRGKPSKKMWDTKEEEMVRSLFDSDYFKEFGPTFAAEKLEDRYNIKVSKETLRKAMIRWGVWGAKKRKVLYKKRRERKAYFGQMIQIDGSPHDWFEGRAPRCTLLVFIDDATSRVVHAEFASSESTHSLMSAMKRYLESHGSPLSIYVDYGSVFSVNTNNPERDKLSQFQRAMKDLDITVIHASSPQAKGRVERVHGTFQDRLVKEMRLANVSSMKKANQFLKEVYLQKHNDKFAIQPREPQDTHRPIQGCDLEGILVIKETRKLQNDFVISYKNKLLQLERNQKAVIFPKNDITVKELLDGRIKLFIRNKELSFHEIIQRPTKIQTGKKPHHRIPFWKPAPDHPWRGSFKTRKTYYKYNEV